MNTLNNANNYSYTENGALTHRSTSSKVYDLFALGGAYRTRSEDDCILLFKNAFEENRDLALKCLFYLRDCRGGQGERRFFRTCFKWLAKEYPVTADKLIKYIPMYGRWDDLFELLDTPCESHVIELVVEQLTCDMSCEKNGVSLCAKWCPSENTSSAITKSKATKIRKGIGLTSKQYRQMLSKLREKINVLERLMSSNQWDKIEFDKIPSKAGLIYKNAFARRDIIAKKYEAFAKDKTTKVNATTLYPYEVVHKAINHNPFGFGNLNETDRAMINKYWENLPDYLNGKNLSMMCVVDTSGSMTGSNADAPINVAIGLGMYCAERIGGPFKNRYISFSSRPQLIEVEGIDFVDKARRIYRTNLCDNTNLEAVFDLLLNVAMQPGVKREDIPKTICVISDMEIDSGTGSWRWLKNSHGWTQETAGTEMEKIRKRWAAAGYELPHLIYWNVDARHNNILDSGPNVTFVSGASPVIFKSVVTGKTGYDLMIETICAARYENITA